MDTVNLKTASAYLNNLLLARGLLRNGKPIQFARPHKAEGGTEQTMAQIINIVHDMVLRRDREQEQRESLAQTIRTLRVESANKTTDVERLEIKLVDVNRQLNQCQTQERAASKAAKAAEAAAKSLKEELAKLKTTINIVRTACANDVRKRDLQLQRLKTHLNAQQRGSRSAASAMTIVIQPGTTGVVREITDTSKPKASVSVDDPAYNLKQETTEFLTQLSQSLSDENDNLIGLVRSTLTTLKGLQGLPENMERLPIIDEQDVPAQSLSNQSVHSPPISFDALAGDMEHVLESLRSILTNPNFVPIEEITVREEEIAKLREGWDKMELKWRETVLLMDNWRRRVLSGDDTVNMDEIKRVLGLGKAMQMETGLLDDDTMALTDADDSIVADELDSSMNDISSFSELGDNSYVQQSPSPSRTRQPLLPAEANAVNKSPKKVSFDISKDKRHQDMPDENAPDSNHTHADATATRSSSIPTKKSRNSVFVVQATMGTNNDDSQPPLLHELELHHGVTALPAAQDKVYMYIDPNRGRGSRSRGRKRSSSLSSHPDEPAQKLTVQEKLNVAQAEAEAAAAAAAAAATPTIATAITGGGDSKLDRLHGADGAVQQEPDANITSRRPRRTGVLGKPKRRKSTLTPDELEQLMCVI